MKFLKLHRNHFIIAFALLAILFALLFVLFFFEVEKSKQMTMKVEPLGRTNLITDSATANILKMNPYITISFNDNFIHAKIISMTQEADYVKLELAGTQGKLLPGIDVLVTVIYDTTTLFKSMFGL